MLTYTQALVIAIAHDIVRPMHRNDEGVHYVDCPIRPLDGHDPRDTVAQCPTCN